MSGSVLWERLPHTAVKHRILSSYLQAWFPIMAAVAAQGFTYAEGFAGPGEYRCGSDGSPLIAIRQALRGEVQLHNKTVRVLCIEKDRAAVDHLLQHVSSEFGSRIDRINFKTVQGGCKDIFVRELEKIEAFTGPIFANFDGWGADAPYEAVRRVGQCPSSEVLVTFNETFFNRFSTLENNSAGDVVFGDPSWRKVNDLGSSQDKKAYLTQTYLQRLEDAGFTRTLTFELISVGGQKLVLFFGTTNEKGLSRMKEAMWKADPISGQRFRDPTDPDQLAFEIHEPNFAPLQRVLLEQLSDGPKSYQELKNYTLLHTIYREPHASAVLDALARLGKIQTTSGLRHDKKMVSMLTQENLFG